MVILTLGETGKETAMRYVIAIVGLAAACLAAGCACPEQTSRCGFFERNLIEPGGRVGCYTFEMSRDEVLRLKGEPDAVFCGKQTYSLDALPRVYYLSYADVCILFVDAQIRGITAKSSVYRLANGLGVGSSQEEIIGAFGEGCERSDNEWKIFLAYREEGLTFEIEKNSGRVMEIDVRAEDPVEEYGEEKIDL